MAGVDKKKNSGPESLGIMRCNNGIYYCGKLCPIQRIYNDKETGQKVIEAQGFNAHVNLCLDCCNKIAAEWEIPFEDLDLLMVAIGNARAGKMGKGGSQEEILVLYGKLGGKRRYANRTPPNQYVTPSPARQLPTGDLWA